MHMVSGYSQGGGGCECPPPPQMKPCFQSSVIPLQVAVKWCTSSASTWQILHRESPGSAPVVLLLKQAASSSRPSHPTRRQTWNRLPGSSCQLKVPTVTSQCGTRQSGFRSQELTWYSSLASVNSRRALNARCFFAWDFQADTVGRLENRVARSGRLSSERRSQ